MHDGERPVVWFIPTSWLLAGSEAQTSPFQMVTPQISDRSKQSEAGVGFGKGHGVLDQRPVEEEVGEPRDRDLAEPDRAIGG